MSDDNDNKNEKKVDQTVKELIDGSTRADLERWFGLPSYEALAEQGVHPEPPPEDPKLAERRKRQDTALAAIDPALVEAHRRRTDGLAHAIRPVPEIALHVDLSIVQLDTAMIAQRSAIAEPREVERPRDIDDAVREDCTPQALLRDLHRPELYFSRELQRVDVMESYRLDIAANIDEVMATSTKLPPPGTPLFDEGYALLKDLRAERDQPWTEIEMPRRRVTE
jgi:hypothetical protein